MAATVISFLGQTPPFADLTGGSNLVVTLSPGAYLWAGAGALLAGPWLNDMDPSLHAYPAIVFQFLTR